MILGEKIIITHCIAVNDEGEIFVGGVSPDFDNGGTAILLVKLKPDGAIDATFGNNGIYFSRDEDAPWQELTLDAVTTLPGGKVLITGMTEAPSGRMHYVTRLLADGSPDNSFGSNGTTLRQYLANGGPGIYSTFVRGIHTLSDGSIVTTAFGQEYQGSFFYNTALLYARFLSDGTPDPSFGTGGFQELAYNASHFMYPGLVFADDVITSIFVDENGLFSLMRTDNDGIPIGGFGTGGVASGDIDPPYNMEASTYNTPAIEHPDGKITAGVCWYDDDFTPTYYLFRLLANGSPDMDFGAGGMVNIVTGTNESFVGKSLYYVPGEDAVILSGMLYDLDEFMAPSGSRIRSYKILNDGSLDAGYGTEGYYEHDLGFWAATLEAWTATSDGKIYLAGFSMHSPELSLLPRLLVVRLNNNGQVDEGLISGRIPAPGSEVMKILTNDAGKIMLAGNSTVENKTELLLRQLLSNGQLDPTFRANSSLPNAVIDDKLHVYDMATTDQALYTAGYTQNLDEGINHILVSRFHPDGRTDIDFGESGRVATAVKGRQARALAVAIQSNGRVLASGEQQGKPYFARFTSSGDWDNSFGSGGELTFDAIGEINGLLLTPDQEILATGHNPAAGGNRNFILYKVSPAGVPDAGFGSGGKLEVDMGTNNDLSQHIARYTDGKILIGGAVGPGAGIVRLLPNGNIDTDFGDNGKTYLLPGPITGIGDMLLQDDNRILTALTVKVGDEFKLAVARLLPDGTMDTEFGAEGIVYAGLSGKNHIAQSLAHTPEGDILMVGTILYSSGRFGSLLIKVLGGTALGLVDNRSDHISLFIFPQPVRTSFTLDYELATAQHLTLQLFDMQGRMVQGIIESQYTPSGKNRANITLSPLLPAGTYFLRMSYGNSSRTIQVVKQ